MSTAVMKSPIEQPAVDQSVLRLVIPGAPQPVAEELADPHPLVPVFIIGAIAFMLTALTIGSIVAGLMLRNSGIMAQ